MNSLAYIPASDGAANASLMTVTNVRSGGATTIQVNTVANAPAKFYGSMGTPHTFTDPVTGETITVISEATAVDFAGEIDGSNVEIVEIAPGYSDNGSEVGDIIVIRPITEWANNVHNVLAEGHADDGSHRGGILGNKIFYTASDTWTKPANLKFVIVTVLGGGGGGGGSGTDNARGAGGGGGAYSVKKILAAALGTSEAVSVGAAGNGGAAGNNAGSAGGSSSFGSHLTAPGGGGGNAANGVFATNGAAASGGDLNIDGQSGVARRSGNSIGVGLGGASPMGFGAPLQAAALNSANEPGGAGTGFGVGGGGGYRSSSTSQPGGAGTGGIVIVEEYFE